MIIIIMVLTICLQKINLDWCIPIPSVFRMNVAKQNQIHELSYHDIILWYPKTVFVMLLNYSKIEAATFCCRSSHLISLLPILGQSYVPNFADKRPKDLHGSAGRWDGYF